MFDNKIDSLWLSCYVVMCYFPPKEPSVCQQHGKLQCTVLNEVIRLLVSTHHRVLDLNYRWLYQTSMRHLQKQCCYTMPDYPLQLELTLVAVVEGVMNYVSNGVIRGCHHHVYRISKPRCNKFFCKINTLCSINPVVC